MARIGFYHLQRQGLSQVLPRLLERALEAGFRVKLLTAGAAETRHLDEALWTYEAGSFLPHGAAGDGAEDVQPILVTEAADNPNGATLLCQTGGAEAASLAGFERVLDIFDGNDEAAVAAARRRWARYKAAGHTIEYHQERPGGGWERKA